MSQVLALQETYSEESSESSCDDPGWCPYEIVHELQDDAEQFVESARIIDRVLNFSKQCAFAQTPSLFDKLCADPDREVIAYNMSMAMMMYDQYDTNRFSEMILLLQRKQTALHIMVDSLSLDRFLLQTLLRSVPYNDQTHEQYVKARFLARKMSFSFNRYKKLHRYINEWCLMADVRAFESKLHCSYC